MSIYANVWTDYNERKRVQKKRRKKDSLLNGIIRNYSSDRSEFFLCPVFMYGERGKKQQYGSRVTNQLNNYLIAYEGRFIILRFLVLYAN